MRVCLFGGSGSLGHAMLRRLVARGVDHVRVVSRDEQKHVELRRRYREAAIPVETIVGDCRVYEDVVKAIADTDLVVFMAAMKHVDICEQYPGEAVKTNVIGPLNIVRAMEELETHRRPTKIVAISTDKAVDPINAYGMSKALQERVWLSASLPEGLVTIVRYGNVLWSNGSILCIAREKVERGEPMLVTSPTMTRFLFTLDAAVDLIDFAVRYPVTTVLVPRLPASTVGDLLDRVLPVEHPREVVGVRPGEKEHESLVSVEEVCVSHASAPASLGGCVYDIAYRGQRSRRATQAIEIPPLRSDLCCLSGAALDDQLGAYGVVRLASSVRRDP